MNSLRGTQAQGNKVVVELEPTEEKKGKKGKTSAVNQQASAINPLEKKKKKLEPKPKKEKIDTKTQAASSTIKPKSDEINPTELSESEYLKFQEQIFNEQFKNGRLEKKLKLHEKIKNLIYQDKQ